MHATFQEAWQQILSAHSVNIYTHRGPDGDSLGSCVGLKRMINYVQPQIKARVIVLDALAGKLATCDSANDTQTVDEAADLFVYPDTPMSKMVVVQHTPSVCIDHHVTRSLDLDYTYAKDWPSCCGLLYREFSKMGLQIPPIVAEAFLIGAVTDTGFGQFGNRETRENAMRDINDLDAICGKYNRSFVNTFSGLTLHQEEIFSKVMPYVKMVDSVLTLRVPDEIASTLNLSDIRMTLQEITARMSANFYIWGYKSKDERRFSVRGDGKDLTVFAARYGGGGHVGASSFESSIEPQRIFDDFVAFTKK